MNRCDWASCKETADRQVEGWWMCPGHVREHYRMLGQDMPRPRIPPQPLTTEPRQLRPCGTRSAAERHRQQKQPVCEACRQAESDYYRERWLRRRQKAAA